jgi:hypothetical protein
MVQTIDQTTTTTTTTTTGSIGAGPTEAQVIQTEPIVKTIQEAPIIENIIEKKNVEIHQRDVVKEIHEQPIIEIERRQQIQVVQQQPIENKVVAPTKFEEVGERTIPELPIQQQTEVTPQVETSVTQKELPPIVETIVEQPVYKQVIIEQHEIPVQTVYTTVPIVHQAQQENLLTDQSFRFTQMQTELTNVQQQQQQQQQQQMSSQTTVQPEANQDRIRIVRSGYGKSVWGLSYGGELFRMNRQPNLGIMWEKFAFWEGAPSTFRFLDFSIVKNGYIWLIGLEDRQLYFMDPSIRHESMIKSLSQNIAMFPRVKSVSAYDANHCYLLAEDGSIFFYDNAKLLRINGQLKALSAGDPHRRIFSKTHFELWGIGMENTAKRYNGIDAWLDTGMVVRDICVGRDNSVYAIDANGQLIRWFGNRFEQCRTKFSDFSSNQPIQFTSVSAFKENSGV